jgi:hypothetical protein
MSAVPSVTKFSSALSPDLVNYWNALSINLTELEANTFVRLPEKV